MMSDSHNQSGTGKLTTVSTRVGPRRHRYVATHCDHTQQSKAAFLRRLIRLHEVGRPGRASLCTVGFTLAVLKLDVRVKVVSVPVSPRLHH